MDARAVLADSTVRVRPSTFAVVKARRPDPDAFATIDDGNEVTVVAESGRYDEAEDDPGGEAGINSDSKADDKAGNNADGENGTNADAIAVEDGWRLLTFDVVLPFDLVGFLAEVAGVLADADVSIFALSAYSTDHILVKDADLDTALERLGDLGCTIEHEVAGER